MGQIFQSKAAAAQIPKPIRHESQKCKYNLADPGQQGIGGTKGKIQNGITKGCGSVFFLIVDTQLYGQGLKKQG